MEQGHSLTEPESLANPLLLGRTLSTRHCLGKGLENQVSVSQARCSSRTACPCSEQLCERQGDWRLSGVDLGSLPLGYATELVFYKGRDMHRLKAELNHSEQWGSHLRGLGREDKEQRMGPQQGKVTSPRCGLMKRRRVLGRSPLHQLPRKRSVTSALHLVLSESDLYWGMETCHASGECWARTGAARRGPGALVLRTQWTRHQLKSPQWTGEEKDTLSHQGWGGAENGKHVSSSMGETSCARGEGRAPPLRVWAPASAPTLKRHQKVQHLRALTKSSTSSFFPIVLPESLPDGGRPREPRALISAGSRPRVHAGR